MRAQVSGGTGQEDNRATSSLALRGADLCHTSGILGNHVTSLLKTIVSWFRVSFREDKSMDRVSKLLNSGVIEYEVLGDILGSIQFPG